MSERDDQIITGLQKENLKMRRENAEFRKVCSELRDSNAKHVNLRQVERIRELNQKIDELENDLMELGEILDVES